MRRASKFTSPMRCRASREALARLRATQSNLTRSIVTRHPLLRVTAVAKPSIISRSLSGHKTLRLSSRIPKKASLFKSLTRPCLALARPLFKPSKRSLSLYKTAPSSPHLSISTRSKLRTSRKRQLTLARARSPQL